MESTDIRVRDKQEEQCRKQLGAESKVEKIPRKKKQAGRERQTDRKCECKRKKSAFKSREKSSLIAKNGGVQEENIKLYKLEKIKERENKIKR